jgi:hypothetical protein
LPCFRWNAEANVGSGQRRTNCGYGIPATRGPGTASASHSQVPETSMQENLEKLAYGLWQQRGCPYGSPEIDSLEAERKLRQSFEHASR